MFRYCTKSVFSPVLQYGQSTKRASHLMKLDYLNEKRHLTQSKLLYRPHKDSHPRAVTATLHNISINKLSDPVVVDLFLSKLDDKARQTLTDELQKYKQSTPKSDSSQGTPLPKRKQYLNGK